MSKTGSRYTRHVYNNKQPAAVTTRPIVVKSVPQTQKLEPSQVTNRAGGFTYDVGWIKQLDRFFILGPGGVGGTYYATQQQLIRENAKVVDNLLRHRQGAHIVQRAVEMRSRAPRLDPILFALALVMASDDERGKQAVVSNLSSIAWTGTQFFQFVAMCDDLRGWGRSLRRACQAWYRGKSAIALAKSMTKYRSRNGWRHRDVLLKASVRPVDDDMNLVFKYIVSRDKGNDEEMAAAVEAVMASNTPAAAYLWNIEQMWRFAAEGNIAGALAVAHGAQLPRELLPTQLLDKPETWEVLLPGMNVMALLRNLNKMSALGMTEPYSWTSNYVISKLQDEQWIKDSKVHPVEFMQAWYTYRQGHGLRGSLTWDASFAITHALEEAFYMAFQNVTPIDKRVFVSVDESGSMSTGPGAIGTEGMLQASDCAGLMAMLRVRAEQPQNLLVTAFDTSIREVNIGRTSGLNQVLHTFRAGGGTDASLPFEYLLDRRLAVDYVEIHTDNETWAGDTHLAQQIERYRQAVNPDVRVAVFAYTATRNSVLRQNVDYCLDVVGFDSAAPDVASSFARGEF